MNKIINNKDWSNSIDEQLKKERKKELTGKEKVELAIMRLIIDKPHIGCFYALNGFNSAIGSSKSIRASNSLLEVSLNNVFIDRSRSIDMSSYDIGKELCDLYMKMVRINGINDTIIENIVFAANFAIRQGIDKDTIKYEIGYYMDHALFVFDYMSFDEIVNYSLIKREARELFVLAVSIAKQMKKENTQEQNEKMIDVVLELPIVYQAICYKHMPAAFLCKMVEHPKMKKAAEYFMKVIFGC